MESKEDLVVQVTMLESIIKETMCELWDKLNEEIRCESFSLVYRTRGGSLEDVLRYVPDGGSMEDVKLEAEDKDVVITIRAKRQRELSQDELDLAISTRFNRDFPGCVRKKLSLKGFVFRQAKKSRAGRIEAMKIFMSEVIDSNLGGTEGLLLESDHMGQEEMDDVFNGFFDVIRLVNQQHPPFSTYHKEDKHRLVAAYFAILFFSVPYFKEHCE